MTEGRRVTCAAEIIELEIGKAHIGTVNLHILCCTDIDAYVCNNTVVTTNVNCIGVDGRIIDCRLTLEKPGL